MSGETRRGENSEKMSYRDVFSVKGYLLFISTLAELELFHHFQGWFSIDWRIVIWISVSIIIAAALRHVLCLT